MPEIKISPRNYARLLRHSESFEDTPDDVIGRLLDHAGNATHAKDNGDRRARAPVPPGSILPAGEYWQPILGLIAEAGGSAPANDVIDALETRMADDLTDLDHQTLTNGEVRWRNRARFARLRMKERGLLSDTSPRGVWEITNAGRAYLDRSA